MIKKIISFILATAATVSLFPVAYANVSEESDYRYVNMVELGQADTNGQSVIDCFVC